jgi:hypothetical protein
MRFEFFILLCLHLGVLCVVTVMEKYLCIIFFMMIHTI